MVHAQSVAVVLRKKILLESGSRYIILERIKGHNRLFKVKSKIRVLWTSERELEFCFSSVVTKSRREIAVFSKKTFIVQYRPNNDAVEWLRSLYVFTSF